MIFLEDSWPLDWHVIYQETVAIYFLRVIYGTYNTCSDINSERESISIDFWCFDIILKKPVDLPLARSLKGTESWLKGLNTTFARAPHHIQQTRTRLEKQ